jgi:ubiquinone/menaquinone biosynthesis C-methylase UbiE
MAWHHSGMTDQVERYDRIADGYAAWWAPVLAPAVDRLLDRATPWLRDGATSVLDIGTGTGQLAIGALRRWPSLSVVGVDASAGMRAMADRLAGQALGDSAARFRTETAFADALPFPDGAFDVALSSFVFQLVPNRARALREARRVLRRGGSLAYVSWILDDRAFAPDLVFDEVLEAFDIDPGGPDSPRWQPMATCLSTRSRSRATSPS